MSPSIPTSAAQGALPPGFAEAAAAHLESGEALRWAGRGTRLATFLALAPGMALTGLILGLLAWVFLTTKGWAFGDGSAVVAGDLPPEMAARGVGIATLGFLLYYLILFVRRVLDAGRVFFFLTDRRLVAVRGSRSLSTQLRDVGHAKARERYYGGSLAFARGGTLFGLSNIDAALVELETLGIPAEDLRDPAMDEADRPPALALGETIKWSGRRGWRAVVDPSRWYLVALAPALLIFVFTWWIWSKLWFSPIRTANTLIGTVNTIILAVTLALFLGPAILFVLRAGGPFFRDLLVDIFGQLAVTDRRILFLYPVTGTVAREVMSERLQGADLVELAASGRGQIVLTLAQDDNQEPQWVDLFAVPDAAGAVEAMARLVRP